MFIAVLAGKLNGFSQRVCYFLPLGGILVVSSRKRVSPNTLLFVGVILLLVAAAIALFAASVLAGIIGPDLGKSGSIVVGLSPFYAVVFAQAFCAAPGMALYLQVS